MTHRNQVSNVLKLVRYFLRSVELDCSFIISIFRVCVITLAENHPILKEEKTVSQVDYQFDNVNRLCNRVTGKGKRVSDLC